MLRALFETVATIFVVIVARAILNSVFRGFSGAAGAAAQHKPAPEESVASPPTERDLHKAPVLQVYHTAVLYHFFHALGILLVTALARTPSLTPQAGDRVAWLLFAGILLFSGSLYALALSGIRVLGVITPLGGLAFIAGWLWLAFEASRRPI